MTETEAAAEQMSLRHRSVMIKLPYPYQSYLKVSLRYIRAPAQYGLKCRDNIFDTCYSTTVYQSIRNVCKLCLKWSQSPIISDR